MPPIRLFQSPIRIAALILGLTAAFWGTGCAKQVRSHAEDEAEATRLYDRADLMVKGIAEGQYSYAYINFHYIQALKNVDRILTAYPDTDCARKIRDAELKLGPYPIKYFRDVLLVQLGDMKEATESVTNCAIYLYNLPEANLGESHTALGQILETLCRLRRTDEAVIFPVLPADRTYAAGTIIEVVARSEQETAQSMLEGADPAQQPDLASYYGHGLAVGGAKLESLDELVSAYPTPGRSTELGILTGMIERESIGLRDKVDIVKQERERKALADLLRAGKSPEQPKEAPMHYDIAAYYGTHFGSRPAAAATAAYAGFLALQGRLDEARSLVAKLDEYALVGVVGNYYEHLALTGGLDGRQDLHRRLGLSPRGTAQCQAKLVEYLAQDANYSAADAAEASGIAEFPWYRDQFIRAREWGIFYSRRELFYLNEHTIPDLGIKDPAICAQVLLDWFLSPNRLLKGSSWGADQILFKYFSMQREGRPVSRKLLKVDKVD